MVFEEQKKNYSALQSPNADIIDLKGSCVSFCIPGGQPLVSAIPEVQRRPWRVVLPRLAPWIGGIIGELTDSSNRQVDHAVKLENQECSENTNKNNKIPHLLIKGSRWGASAPWIFNSWSGGIEISPAPESLAHANSSRLHVIHTEGNTFRSPLHLVPMEILIVPTCRGTVPGEGGALHAVQLGVWSKVEFRSNL